ncbi:hypothetical protein DYB31_016739 [Aphanomyces astaci]|uniref:Uncharacterized protein n=1 Tax=Aphanomyces astaci TaxID=112090 RepID=A0A397FIE0_APHAT|nr:hypothetical protein DYB31_016739 [Aphanomyces astaci]
MDRIKIFEHLRMLNGAPSVQMTTMPPDYVLREEDEDATTDPDQRTDHDGAKRQHDAEMYAHDKVNKLFLYMISHTLVYTYEE